MEQTLEAYWDDNPGLKAAVDFEKAQEAYHAGVNVAPNNGPTTVAAVPVATPDPWLPVFRGHNLQSKIQESHGVIRESVASHNAQIMNRTQANNRKSVHTNLADEQAEREEVLSEQISLWCKMLPNLIRRFAKLRDYRRATHVKHKITVLMMFGLFAFIFQLASRREINRELTGPVIFEHLHALFPEIDSIPHADTLARVLTHINPKDIEAIHTSLIKDLIRHKKFKHMLIQGCLPISIDGTQKCYRDGDGLLQDQQWCERRVNEDGDKQQYVYVLEANITLKNGLNIPLMTEFLYRHHNQLTQPKGKQDNEVTAFKRLALRLKQYFPRMKLLLMMDALFATQSTIEMMNHYHWDYLIKMPLMKLKSLTKQLALRKSAQQAVEAQEYYRKRHQSFYWLNDIPYGHEYRFTINLIACIERYQVVNPKTGEIEDKFVQHRWLSSFPGDIDTVHEVLNLGARKQALIEDNFNTEKNRGYHYKHLFAYNWQAMQGFHYLMRLAHAINAISEFGKTIKKHVKRLGCGATLKLIRSTLFNPWLPISWYIAETKKTPHYCLQLE